MNSWVCCSSSNATRLFKLLLLIPIYILKGEGVKNGLDTMLDKNFRTFLTL